MSATLGEKLVTGDEEAPPAVVAKPDDNAPPTIAAETDELSNDERWNVLWIIIRIYYLYDSTKAFAIALGGMLTSVLSFLGGCIPTADAYDAWPAAILRLDQSKLLSATTKRRL